MNFKFGKVDYLILALSGLGMLVMAYLTYIKFSDSSYFCDISTTISCSVVNQSAYSELFGIPVAALGFLYFALVGGLVFNLGKSAYRAIFLLSVASLVFSFYLTYIELFVLGTICILCETSKVLILAIAGLTFRRF
jgi:uncharacterized membrane protein